MNAACHNDIPSLTYLICFQSPHKMSAAPTWDFVAQLNNLRREEKKEKSPTLPQKLILKNVLYFDGHAFKGPANIYMHDGKIVESIDGAEELDCTGKFLIPGLIDAHTHPITIKDLEKLTAHGITTTMSMAGFDKGHMASLKGHPGLVDVLATALPAAGPDNKHARSIPNWPEDEMLTAAAQAEEFVKRQIDRGADYIKIIADVPGLDQEIVTALVDAARKHGKRTVCHAASVEPARQALRAKADQVHHSPLNGLLSSEDVEMYKQNGGIVACPTLIMMETTAENWNDPERTLKNAQDNVSLLHRAGVTILCGTDANEVPNVPAMVPFGSSIHREFELLSGAGLSPTEVLLSATALPAKCFGLADRGVIAPGYRADLVLLSANPLEDVGALREVEKVWIRGVLYV